MAYPESGYNWANAWDGNWSDAVNWNARVIPTSSNNVVFNSTDVNGNETIYLNGNRGATLLTFNNSGNTLILGGTAAVPASSTLIITASATNAPGIMVSTGAGTVTIGNSAADVAATITQNQSWNVMPGEVLSVQDVTTNANTAQTLDLNRGTIFGGNVAFNGVVSNNASNPLSGTLSIVSQNMIVGGAPIYTFNSPSTFSGGISIQTAVAPNGQTVQVGADNALGTGLLSLGGSSGGSGTAHLQAIGNARSINNPVNINHTGSGTTFIYGSNSLTLIGYFNFYSTTLYSAITGGLLTLAGDVYISNTDAAAQTATLAGNGNTLITGSIYNNLPKTNVNASNLTITNTGLTTLTNNNTYGGTTTLTNAIVAVSGLSAFGASTVNINSTNNVLINAGNSNFNVNNAATGLTTSYYFLRNNITLLKAVKQAGGSTFYCYGSGGTLVLSAFDLNVNNGVNILGLGNAAFNGIVTNATSSNTATTGIFTHYGVGGTLTLAVSNTYVGQITLQSSGGQSGTGMIGQTIAKGPAPFGLSGNYIYWNGGSGGNGWWEPIIFQADSSPKPAAYAFITANNSGASGPVITLDTATSSAGYARDFFLGNGTNTGVFNSANNFAMQQGPTATSNMTANFINNAYVNTAGYFIPLNNTAGTYGVSMVLLSATVPVAGMALNLDGNTLNNAISGALQNNTGLMSINKYNTSNWSLIGQNNTLTGGINIAGGTLSIGNGNTGSIVTNPVVFTGSGTLNIAESANTSQMLSSIVAIAGEDTIKLTYPGSGTNTVIISGIPALIVSNSGAAAINFVASNGASNKIALSSVAPNTFITGNSAVTNVATGYYSNGSNYAFYDTNNYVRGVNWGVDANTLTTGASASFGNPSSTKMQQITGTISAQAGSSQVGAVNISGANVNLVLGGQLQLWGILKSGTGSSMISGGQIMCAGTGNMYFIRSDSASDILMINSPVITNGTNGLVFTGAGTTIIGSPSNSWTLGTVSVNGVGGKVRLDGSNALGASFLIPSAGVAGGSNTLNVYGGTLDARGGNVGPKTLYLAPGTTLDNSMSADSIISIGQGSGNSNLCGAITNTGGPLTLIVNSVATTVFGSIQGKGFDQSTNTYSGGLYVRGAVNGGPTLTINKASAFGLGPTWFGDIINGAGLNNINTTYSWNGAMSNVGSLFLQQDIAWTGGSCPLMFGSGPIHLCGNRTIFNTSNSQLPITFNGPITDDNNPSGLLIGYSTTINFPPGMMRGTNPLYLLTGASTTQTVLNGNNTFQGGLSAGYGSVTTTANSGTPFGVGNINIVGRGSGANPIGNSSLILNPIGNTNAGLSALTSPGSSFNYSGLAYITTYNQSGGILNFILGSGQSGNIFNRVGRGVLVIDEITSLNWFGKLSNIRIAAGSTSPQVTNGMVTPSIIVGLNNSTTATFATHNTYSGIVPAVMDLVSTSMAGSNSNTKYLAAGNTTISTNASCYALQTGGTFTIGSGTTINIGDGINPSGVIITNSTFAGTDNTSTISFRGSEGIIYASAVSPTISPVISGSNGITFNLVNGNNTCTLTQPPGWVGPTTINSGTLKFTTNGGWSFPAGVDGLGILNISNTANAVTVNQSPGMHYLGGLTVGAATANMILAGVGSTNIVASPPWGGTNGASVTLSSGIWVMPGGNNNISSILLNGATLIITAGRNWFNTVTSTFNISAGNILFLGDRYSNESAGASTTQTTNLVNGLHELAFSQYGFTLGGNTASSTQIFNQIGGAFQVGMSLNTTNQNTNNTMVIGSTKAGNVCSYYLKGGGFRVAGAVSSGGVATGGGSNNFIWTGGTLNAGTMTMANLSGGDGINSAAGTLYQSCTDSNSYLAPGDLAWAPTYYLGVSKQGYEGQFAGKIAITGAYQADASVYSSYMLFNLGGLVQASVFHDAGIGKYDFVSVSTLTTLNSAVSLLVNPLPGFTMRAADAALNVLTSTGNVTGVLANVARGGTIALNDIVFTVNYPNTAAGSIALTVANDTSVNQWNAVTGSNWNTTGSWTGIGAGGIIPNANIYTARFMDAPVATGGNAVNLDTNITVEGIGFNSTTRSYMISSNNGSALTIDNTGGAGVAGINCTNGSFGAGHVIASPITLNSDTYINVQNSADFLTLSSVNGNKNVTIYGAGTLTINGPWALSGALSLNTTTSNKGLVLNSGASLPNLSALNFNGTNNNILINTPINITAPITVNVNSMNGVYTASANQAAAVYIGANGSTPISIGNGNTALFSGPINLIGYSTLSIGVNDSSSNAWYIFSGDVTNSVYSFNSNGPFGAGIQITTTNGIGVQFTGNIGASASLTPINLTINGKGSYVYMGYPGKTVNLYTMTMIPVATTGTITTISPSLKLYLQGDITAYSLVATAVASNSINQIVGTSVSAANNFNIVGSQNMIYNGVIGGIGTNENNIALNSKVGNPFILTLNGVNTFNGGLTIGNGTVSAVCVSATTLSATWAASNSSSVLTVSSTLGLTLGQTVSAGGISAGAIISDILSPTTIGINGATTGTGSLVVFGSGSAVGGPTNSVYLGSTTYNETGKLILVPQTPYATTVVNSISSVGSGIGNAIVGGNSNIASLIVNVVSGNDIFTGNLGGSFINENNLSLVKAGLGTLTLANTNTYTDTTIISSGELQIGTGVDVATISTSSLAVLDTLTFNVGSGNRTYSGALNGAGILNQNGTGTLTLAGTKTFTGSFNINAGKITISSSGMSNSMSAVNVAIGATFSSSLNNGFGTSPTGLWTVNGTLNSAFQAQGLPPNVILNNGAMTGSVFASFGAFYPTNAGTTITCNGSANSINCGNVGANISLTILTPLSTDAVSMPAYYGGSSILTGALTKAGAGTLILGGNNTATGTTTISGGTLQVGVSGTTGSMATSGIVLNNGTFVVAQSGVASSFTFPAISGISGVGSVSATSDTLVFGSGSSCVIATSGAQYYNATSGAGTVSHGNNIQATNVYLSASGGYPITFIGDTGKAGAGGNNLYINTSNGNGAVYLDISVGRSDAWYNLASLNVNAGTGLIYWYGGRGSTTNQSTPIYLSGGIVIAANFWSQNAQSIYLNCTASSLLSGGLYNAASLIKTGTSMLSVTNTQSHTGTTTVSAGGPMNLLGTITTSVVTVNAGTLQGTGFAKNNVIVGSVAGSTIRGGQGGTGTLSAGNITFGSSSSILAVGSDGSSTCSVIALSGTATLNSMTVNFDSTPLNAGSYTIMTASSISGSATQGTLPTGRSWSSLSVSGGNSLVAVLT